MVKLTILSENRDNGNFKGEPGLSILVETDAGKFLFDTGNSDLFMKNAKLLGINLNKIENVVLSHGHSDHTTGLIHLQERKTIIMHPESFRPRWSNRRQEFAGCPISAEDLMKNHNLILTREPTLIQEDAIYLGEIPMVTEHESNGNIATSLDESLTIPDPTEDDSGVAIKTDKGLFVMTGCGHRGVCNTVKHAQNVTGEEKVYAVLGGFHFRSLKNQKDMIDETIKYFKKIGVKKLYLGHCNTDPVIDYMQAELPNVRIYRLGAGKEFELDSPAKIKI